MEHDLVEWSHDNNNGPLVGIIIVLGTRDKAAVVTKKGQAVEKFTQRGLANTTWLESGTSGWLSPAVVGLFLISFYIILQRKSNI